ncbi:hypothetical protein [Brevundimonas lenta]|uniref:DUF4402 domain-containing protein n=1 Tax=Brevundimonas lenta TaxID=424796 RepID=A0A7W6JFQ1_9CAUL|nr:hypothetical protein [Brevundimonas lenta]MBB4084279.1 hypothetical protein [Brevundimonas lenta]
MRAWIPTLFALVLATLAPAVAHAQIAVSRTAGLAPVLGVTIRGASATTFSVSTSGAVTRTSGDAIRLTTGSVRAPTISVSCGAKPNTDDCRNSHIRIYIVATSNSGPASITRFRVSSITNGSFDTGSPPAEGSILAFDINPLGTKTATFNLGMDVRIVAGATPGPDTFDYYVVAQVL